MKFTQIPQDTFKELVLNAGVLLSAFSPDTAEYDNADIIGATSGGLTFSATPSFSDFGEDIDNCPKNTKELKRLESWEVKLIATLEELFEQGVETLPELVNGLNAVRMHDQQGEPWSDASFQAFLQVNGY